MTEITLTPDQLAAIDTAEKMVALCRPNGSIVGLMALTPKTPLFTLDEIEAAERAAGGPSYSTAQVLENLRTLERS
jgi:hypothetical protein